MFPDMRLFPDVIRIPRSIVMPVILTFHVLIFHVVPVVIIHKLYFMVNIGDVVVGIRMNLDVKLECIQHILYMEEQKRIHEYINHRRMSSKHQRMWTQIIQIISQLKT